MKSKKKKTKPTTPTRAFLLKYGLPSALIPGIILAAMYGFNWCQLINTAPKNNPKIFANHQKVAEVIDGDTIKLQTGLPIRLISINAPDSKEHKLNLWSD
jgi:endonuclease YncB( thermonuclease family)